MLEKGILIHKETHEITKVAHVAEKAAKTVVYGIWIIAPTTLKSLWITFPTKMINNTDLCLLSFLNKSKTKTFDQSMEKQYNQED